MDPYTMFAGMYMLCAGIGFIIEILIAIYMYKDAEKRGKSGIVWLLIGLFFGLLGLIIWLIVRPPEPTFYQQQVYQQPPPAGYYQPPPQQQTPQYNQPPQNQQPPNQRPPQNP